MRGSRKGGGVRTPLPEISDLLNSHCKLPQIGFGHPQKNKIISSDSFPALENFFGSAPACTSEYQFNIYFQNYNPMVKISFGVKIRDREVIWKEHISYCAFARFNGFAETSLHNAISNSTYLNNGTDTYIETQMSWFYLC